MSLKFRSELFVFAALVILLLAILIFGTPGISFTAPLKVGFVLLNPIDDFGWTYAHYKGIRELQQKFRNKIQITYIDNVGGSVEKSTSAILGLIGTGNKLIFTTAWDFMNPTINIAKQYPKITFEHCSGYKRANNVGTYFVRIYNMDYLAGIVAGRMAKNGLIGYVAPHPIPEVIRGINAFTLGVRKVNPKAKVIVLWTNSWYDPAKESEYARALIEKGVTVLAHGCDSPAASQTADKFGVYTIGYGNDQSKFAPKTWLTAPLWKWGNTYIKIVDDYINNKWQSKAIWDKYGVALAPFSKLVDSETRAIVQNEYNRIFNNNYNIFSGEIRDQKGEVRIPKGSEMSDSELWEMSWFVQGVIGSIPK